MELISIIVPVYNVEKYLDRCLKSIVNQTYKNLEIILVDDATPDNSGRICDEWAKKDDRIKVIHKSVNEGLGFTRNTGLKAVKGEYVTFVDSDDWIGQDHIKNLYEQIKKENADICVGGYTRAFSNGKRKECKNKVENRVYSENDITEKLLLPLIAPDINFQSEPQILVSCCKNLYRKQIIEEKNILFISERQAASEDIFFNFMCFYYADKIVLADVNEYYYFENLNSISKKYDDSRFNLTVSFYYKMKEMIKNLELEDRVGYRLERIYIGKLRSELRVIATSNLKLKNKLEFMNKVLYDELTMSVLALYPINSYVTYLKIIVLLMKHKQTFILYLLMRFRAKIS